MGTSFFIEWKQEKKYNLIGCNFQVRDDISSVLWFLESNKIHFGFWDIFFRIFKICKEGIFSPDDVCIFVSWTVSISFNGSSFSSKQSIEIWSLFGCSSLFGGVALCATCFEEFFSISFITNWSGFFWCSSSQSQDKVESGFLLDVVISKGSVVFQLFSSKDESLLIRWDPFFVLDFLFYVLDGIRSFNFKSDGFSSECLYFIL